MKYTWKKLLSLSLAAVMALSLAACGQSETADDSQAAESKPGGDFHTRSHPDPRKR